MSCWIVAENSVSAVANLVADVMNLGLNGTGLYNQNGFELSEAFKDCRKNDGWVSPEKVYEKLYMLNYAAYNGRYPTHQQEVDIPKFPNYYLWSKPGYKNGQYICEQKHFQMYKTLQCFIYQCNEDANNGNKTLEALEKLKSELCEFLVTASDMYNQAKWC